MAGVAAAALNGRLLPPVAARAAHRGDGAKGARPAHNRNMIGGSSRPRYSGPHHGGHHVLRAIAGRCDRGGWMLKEELFWARVAKSDTCWLWTGRLNKDGYGLYTVACANGTRSGALAHRLSYRLMVGPIADGLTLDHLCRVRRCVNPAHLEPVSLRVNIRRGESPSGKNFRRTRCIRGHPFDDKNTRRWVMPSGKVMRTCRICDCARQRAYKARLRSKEEYSAR